MPRNKFQEIIFTALMAFAMVYGMVVYNVAISTGEINATTFVAALARNADHVSNCFCLRVLFGRQACGYAGFSCGAPDRQTAGYHFYDVSMYLLYYVPGDEFNCDSVI